VRLTGERCGDGKETRGASHAVTPSAAGLDLLTPLATKSSFFSPGI
jgi:hypothetical protein